MAQVVGRPTPRVEGIEKVTGSAVYSADVALPNTLWGKILRSPIPYGRIKRIDASRAAQVPGVKSVITGQDVAGLLIGRQIYDTPILANDVVRFVGDKVAAVAAETEEAADQALELIDVEYEELEPVLDSLEALKPTAPLIHPDVLSYKGLPSPLESASNLFGYFCWGNGDVDAGFQQADEIVENTFQTQVVHQSYIEPHACVVKADASGGAEIWACCKTPFAVRRQLSNSVGIPQEKLVFHPVHIGGDFGGKGGFMNIPVGYFLSLKSGAPVKVVMDYDEELSAGNPRHASVIKVKTGVKRDGTIVAHHMEFVFDSGAYGSMKPAGYLRGPMSCAGPYRIANCKIEEKMVYTNKVPCGHMRAPGDPQGFFANESQMDIVARKLGMDPADFRRKNLLRDGDVSPMGETMSHIKGVEALDKALSLSGYQRPKAKNVGRGIAFAEWGPGGGEGNVFIKIAEDGTITVSSPVVDQGAGSYTVICGVVAEELKTSTDRLKFVHMDTSTVPSDGGVGGSRATRVYGNAAYEAALKAKEELFAIAGDTLKASPTELSLADEKVVHQRSKRRMTFAELVRAKGSPIEAQGYYKQSQKTHHATIAAQIAEVEVDPETGQIKLRQFVSAHTTGKVINPLGHQGQIEGGVVFGLGYALTEHVMFDEGKVLTTNFGDYKIPNIQDIPPLKTAVMETVPGGPGPYNSLPIGEVANVPTAPAIVNAIEDAVGVRITSLPITAEKVFAVTKP
ncbi:MAG: molybdopterin-dependent oxidoreductase [Deltaproteobacteria bacterium]|nr:molybdopterin-dependent oxidoreductase [Deltaproteobacteria bacterium]